MINDTMIRDSMTSHEGNPGATLNPRRQPQRIGVRELLLLLALTGGAVVLHGYHGGVEDAEIYLPGVLKHLNPALYPRNSEFFGSHEIGRAHV